MSLDQLSALAPLKAKTHPPTRVMVDNALKSLADRNGSSLVAIKKFIANTYNVDVGALSSRIKKYILECLSNGKYVKTTGKGITGSFKMSSSYKDPKERKTKMKIKQTGLKKKPSVKEKIEDREEKENKAKSKKASSVKKNPPDNAGSRPKNGIRV